MTSTISAWTLWPSGKLFSNTGCLRASVADSFLSSISEKVEIKAAKDQVWSLHNSILFCWLFTIKDQCKQLRFWQTHNQGCVSCLWRCPGSYSARLAQQTWWCRSCFSVCTHEGSRGPLVGDVSAQKAIFFFKKKKWVSSVQTCQGRRQVKRIGALGHCLALKSVQFFLEPGYESKGVTVVGVGLMVVLCCWWVTSIRWSSQAKSGFGTLHYTLRFGVDLWWSTHDGRRLLGDVKSSGRTSRHLSGQQQLHNSKMIGNQGGSRDPQDFWKSITTHLIT